MPVIRQTWDESDAVPFWAMARFNGSHLYDLENDPGEMQNLFGDPAHAKVRKELEDMMRARPGKVREKLAEPIGMA